MSRRYLELGYSTPGKFTIEKKLTLSWTWLCFMYSVALQWR